MRRSLPLALPFVALLSGCAALQAINNAPGEYSDRKSKEKGIKYIEEGPGRVVYTQLSSLRTSNPIDEVDVLLRDPSEPFKVIALLNIYQEYGNETASDLIGFVKTKAKEIGADAIILLSAENKPVGLSSSGSASYYNGLSLSSSNSVIKTSGEIKTVAIVYKDKTK